MMYPWPTGSLVGERATRWDVAWASMDSISWKMCLSMLCTNWPSLSGTDAMHWWHTCRRWESVLLTTTNIANFTSHPACCDQVNEELHLDRILNNLRLDMPSCLSSGRRFPRDLTHASVSSWSAEECLICIRFGWRHFFRELFSSYTCALEKDVPPSLHEFHKGFEILEALILAVLDRRGFQGPSWSHTHQPL